MPSPLFSIWFILLSPFFTASLPFFSHNWENENFCVKWGLNEDHFSSLVLMRTKSSMRTNSEHTVASGEVRTMLGQPLPPPSSPHNLLSRSCLAGMMTQLHLSLGTSLTLWQPNSERRTELQCYKELEERRLPPSGCKASPRGRWAPW